MALFASQQLSALNVAIVSLFFVEVEVVQVIFGLPESVSCPKVTLSLDSVISLWYHGYQVQ